MSTVETDVIHTDLSADVAETDVQIGLEPNAIETVIEAHNGWRLVDWKELIQYRDFDSKHKIEEARLSLQASKDRATESAEELAQIELMYKDQDLDDRTAEFVIQRGRRHAARAAARIKLQEMAFQTLDEHEVPVATRQHTLDVAQKQVAVEAGKRSLEVERLKGQISIASAKLEIEELRQEITRLRSKR